MPAYGVDWMTAACRCCRFGCNSSWSADKADWFAADGTGLRRVIKYWFSISDEEQNARFLSRIHDPLKQWKLSPMDLESRRRWEEYTKAKELMLDRTHIPEARWWVVQGVDKKRARLNCIHHLLQRMPYVEIDRPTIQLPEREYHEDYVRQPVPPEIIVPEIY